MEVPVGEVISSCIIHSALRPFLSLRAYTGATEHGENVAVAVYCLMSLLKHVDGANT